jgi:hypothetical protein
MNIKEDEKWIKPRRKYKNSLTEWNVKLITPPSRVEVKKAYSFTTMSNIHFHSSIRSTLTVLLDKRDYAWVHEQPRCLRQRN